MWSRYLNVTYRRTDRQSDGQIWTILAEMPNSDTALCVTSPCTRFHSSVPFPAALLPSPLTCPMNSSSSTVQIHRWAISRYSSLAPVAPSSLKPSSALPFFYLLFIASFSTELQRTVYSGLTILASKMSRWVTLTVLLIQRIDVLWLLYADIQPFISASLFQPCEFLNGLRDPQ